MYDEKQLRQQTKSMLIGKLFSEGKALAEAEARLGVAKARATAFFDEGIKRADTIRDLEARLAAVQETFDNEYRHVEERDKRIADLELETLRLTNDVDHRIATLEAQLREARK